MSTPEPDSTFDENVISEILRVQERAHGVREARAALARWVSRAAFALAMLVLCTGLVVGLVNGVDAATATPYFAVAGVGALLLGLSLLAYMLGQSPGFLLAGKWGNLEGHYWEAYPEESKEAVRRAFEAIKQKERTNALEAIVRDRNRMKQQGGK